MTREQIDAKIADLRTEYRLLDNKPFGVNIRPMQDALTQKIRELEAMK